MMKLTNNIEFRPLEVKDLTLLHRWLNTDHVNEWYNKGGSTYDDVVKKYLPRINGEQPIHSFIIVYDAIDIGYIQTYRIDDYPEYSKYVKAEEPSAGLDLFIGEKNFIHIGLGKEILQKFLTNYVFLINNVNCCIIGPEPLNKIAIRAYEKVGFVYYKMIQIPDEDEPEYLMRIYKNDIPSL
jgi:RimJ/RimL family protein N-acetyltransferase